MLAVGGWSMRGLLVEQVSDRRPVSQTLPLPYNPLQDAIALPQVPQALDKPESFHGCQYTSLAFGRQLQAAGILPSTGSVGDAYDNAVVGSFFSSLKVELLARQAWPTRAAARRAIFEYIEIWFNRRRRHSTLGYLGPAAYEALARKVAAT
jgi:transposase InsO family protein